MKIPLISRLIDHWVELVQRLRFVVIALALAICGYSIYFIINHIGMSTDTKDMLSEDLSWRQLDIEYERVFTETLDNVVIVVEASTPDAARASALTLYQALLTDPVLLNDIYYPAALPFFQQSAFLFMEETELYDLADQLAAIQPFIGILLEDKTLRGLFSMLSDALQAIEDGEEIDLDPLLLEINRALESQQYQVSWQRLISADTVSKDVYREFIIAQTLEAPGEFLPGQAAINRINKTIDRLQLENEQTRIRLTGPTALAYEELKSVSEANIIAIAASLVMVTVILMFGLSSIWLFFASLVTLIMGLITTTAFAAATVGTLNLISVAFAVLYIGLGIDFAIHLGLRYREESILTTDNSRALSIAFRQMFRSLFLCALTTAIGFYSFMPTDYQGVAELGWIAGSGMFISLLYTFTLLPALLSLRQYRALHDRRPAHEHPVLQRLSQLPYRYPKHISLASLVLVVITLATVKQIGFDSNTLNLQDPENESVQTYQDLLADSETSPWFVVLITTDRAEAEEHIRNIKKLDIVDRVIWSDDLVPANQEDKLFIVDDLNLMLGELDDYPQPEVIKHNQRVSAVNALLSKLSALENIDSAQVRLLKANLQNLTGNMQSDQLEDLEQRLLVHLDGSIDSLAKALTADSIDTSDIPQQVLSRWFKQDYYKLEIYPADDLSDNDAMIRFVRELQDYNDKIIGAPVINVEAGEAVITAFKSAIIYALIAISLLLFLLIKVKLDALLILISVIIGGIFTLTFMLLLGLPFNFANIIGLPLLLGIGVDSGIHIANRFRHEHSNGGNIFMTSASRGVFVSSMTTVCSIGNLAFSAHTGTATMGILLTVGLIAMMVSTMIVLPAFLIWHSRNAGQ